MKDDKKILLYPFDDSNKSKFGVAQDLFWLLFPFAFAVTLFVMALPYGVALAFGIGGGIALMFLLVYHFGLGENAKFNLKIMADEHSFYFVTPFSTKTISYDRFSDYYIVERNFSKDVSPALKSAYMVADPVTSGLISYRGNYKIAMTKKTGGSMRLYLSYSNRYQYDNVNNKIEKLEGFLSDSGVEKSFYDDPLTKPLGPVIKNLFSWKRWFK